MKEIIGVYHSGKKVKDAVITYITKNHPNLESLMLELPENWKDVFFRYKLDDDFFLPLALNYSEQSNVKVIAGDCLHYEIDGGFENFISELYFIKNLPYKKQNLRKHYETIKLAMLYEIRDMKSMLNGKFIHDRNIDMARIAMEQDPEVVVLGNVHASFLKQFFPEAKYTFIAPRESTLVLMVDRLYKWLNYPSNPDNTLRV